MEAVRSFTNAFSKFDERFFGTTTFRSHGHHGAKERLLGIYGSMPGDAEEHPRWDQVRQGVQRCEEIQIFNRRESLQCTIHVFFFFSFHVYSYKLVTVCGIYFNFHSTKRRWEKVELSFDSASCTNASRTPSNSA